MDDIVSCGRLVSSKSSRHGRPGCRTGPASVASEELTCFFFFLNDADSLQLCAYVSRVCLHDQSVNLYVIMESEGKWWT